MNPSGIEIHLRKEPFMGHPADGVQQRPHRSQARSGGRVCHRLPRGGAEGGIVLLADGLASPGCRSLSL